MYLHYQKARLRKLYKQWISADYLAFIESEAELN